MEISKKKIAASVGVIIAIVVILCELISGAVNG